MSKKLYLLVLLVFSISFISYAQWVALDKTSIPGSKPIVTLVSDNPTETVIKINIPGFYVNNLSVDGKTYQQISFGEGEGKNSETGYPDLPDIAKVLAIPDNGTAQIEVLETGPVQKIEGLYVLPVRESSIEGQPEKPYLENAGCYSSDKLYPAKLTSIEEPSVFRDFRIARVAVFPLRYIPVKHEIQAVSSITVRVRYNPGLGVNPKTSPHRPIAPSFAKIYGSVIFNYNEVLQRDYGGREDGQDMMLCIMPDNMADTFLPYADWKEKSGTLIHITKFSDIGANNSNPDIIKNHILAAYLNWPVPPTHVLLVGDAGIFPYKTVTLDGWTFANEDYFVELVGDDFLPELYIGRFTNQTTNQLLTIINKIVNYEEFPYTDDITWYKKATVCSNNFTQSQVVTKRFTANEMETFGYYSVDTLMSAYPCYANLNDVLATINSGISLLNYRGEGWSDGWHANCYYFSTSDVTGLNNGRKLPFVTSIGCGVAMFNGTECFGEAWLELGTPTAPRGACAFLGATSNTHTPYNNEIDKGIYIGMFEEGMDTPGEALLRGKLLMYNVFGATDPYVPYHYKIFCELGDPSTHVWKDVPRQVNVDYPNIIPSGYSQPQVTVTYSATGNPVRDARVCVFSDNVHVVAYTDINGVALLNLNTTEGDTLTITVCGQTVYPYQGTITVIPAVENIAPTSNTPVTDLDGDHDGLIDPNENCTIIFTLKNWGNTSSNNVTAALSVPDSVSVVNIVTTEPVSYGNIASGDSVTGSPFQFFIHPDCPVGFVIPFKLHVTSATSSWDYYISKTVHGCNLNYTQYLVDDSGNLLHNYRMDPGETVKLILTIKNSGDDIAPDVKGVLRSTDQYVTITDSTGLFGSVHPDSSATNESDVFVIKVADNCPVRHEVSYDIKLMTQNGTYPYSHTQTFNIPVAMPSASDPTGPDQYGYYALSSDDTLWQQSPKYGWIDIIATGTQIDVPQHVSDYTETVTLPFSFKYYGNTFTDLRVSTDGWVAFGSGIQTTHDNFHLPCADAVKDMTAAFWDNLYLTDGETGKIYYYNDATNHRFIVEWDQIHHVENSNDKETFEVILLDPAFDPTTTGDGEIIMQYGSVQEPGSCTIGIENDNQDIGLTYLYNGMYDTTASEIRNGSAIKFTTLIPLVVSVDERNNKSLIPDKYTLSQNYPNPFNPDTRIRYTLPEAGLVTLKIYRIDGELVRTIQDDYQSAGVYEKVWDGRNDHGTIVSSGVYFYRICANNFVQVKKMVLLK